MKNKTRTWIAGIFSAVACFSLASCGNEASRPDQHSQFYQKSDFQPFATVNGEPSFFDESYVDAYMEFQDRYLELTRQRIEQDYSNNLLTQEQYDEKMAAYQTAKSEITRDAVIEELVKDTILEQEASKRGVNLSVEESIDEAKAYTDNLKQTFSADTSTEKDESIVLFEAFLEDLGMTYEEYAESYLAYSFYIREIEREVTESLADEKGLADKSDEVKNEAYASYMDQLYQKAKVVE